MSQNGIFTNWSHQHTELYGKKPMHVRHRLHRSELFTDEALAALIERLPRSHYHVNTMAPAGDRTMMWREGQIEGLSGQEVMDAVRNGQIWVSLQRLEEIDDNFAAMLGNIYDDVESRVDGLSTYKRSLGLLISSPKAQVYYHCDIPGQSLWQIRGRKRVYVYPATVPFLTPEYMETIVLGEADEEHMPYEPWYDEHAAVYEMEAGDMLHWPLNAPHRVENLDCLNVSLTTEHWADDLRASYAVHYANGVLRRWTGGQQLARQTSGAGLYAKMALAAAVKYSGITRRRQRKFRIDFQVDPTSSRGFRDITAFDMS